MSERELGEIGRDGTTVVGGGLPGGPDLGPLLAAATGPVVVVPAVHRDAVSTVGRPISEAEPEPPPVAPMKR